MGRPRLGGGRGGGWPWWRSARQVILACCTCCHAHSNLDPLLHSSRRAGGEERRPALAGETHSARVFSDWCQSITRCL